LTNHFGYWKSRFGINAGAVKVSVTNPHPVKGLPARGKEAMKVTIRLRGEAGKNPAALPEGEIGMKPLAADSRTGRKENLTGQTDQKDPIGLSNDLQGARERKGELKD